MKTDIASDAIQRIEINSTHKPIAVPSSKAVDVKLSKTIVCGELDGTFQGTLNGVVFQGQIQGSGEPLEETDGIRTCKDTLSKSTKNLGLLNMALSLLEGKLNASLLENTTASTSYAKQTNEEMLKQELFETKTILKEKERDIKSMVKEKERGIKSKMKDRDKKIKDLEEKIKHMQNVMQNGQPASWQPSSSTNQPTHAKKVHIRPSNTLPSIENDDENDSDRDEDLSNSPIFGPFLSSNEIDNEHDNELDLEAQPNQGRTFLNIIKDKIYRNLLKKLKVGARFQTFDDAEMALFIKFTICNGIFYKNNNHRNGIHKSKARFTVTKSYSCCQCDVIIANLQYCNSHGQVQIKKMNVDHDCTMDDMIKRQKRLILSKIKQGAKRGYNTSRLSDGEFETMLAKEFKDVESKYQSFGSDVQLLKRYSMLTNNVFHQKIVSHILHLVGLHKSHMFLESTNESNQHLVAKLEKDLALSTIIEILGFNGDRRIIDTINSLVGFQAIDQDRLIESLKKTMSRTIRTKTIYHDSFSDVDIVSTAIALHKVGCIMVGFNGNKMAFENGWFASSGADLTESLERNHALRESVSDDVQNQECATFGERGVPIPLSDDEPFEVEPINCDHELDDDLEAESSLKKINDDDLKAELIDCRIEILNSKNEIDTSILNSVYAVEKDKMVYYLSSLEEENFTVPPELTSAMDEFLENKKDDETSVDMVYFQNILCEELNLEKSIRVLVLDGMCVKIKDAQSEDKFSTLLVMNCKYGNNRTVPWAFALCGNEYAQSWTNFLTTFKSANPWFVESIAIKNWSCITDGENGMRLAMRLVFPEVTNTTCTFHLEQNVLKCTSPKYRRAASKWLNTAIHSQHSSVREEAVAKLKASFATDERTNKNSTFHLISTMAQISRPLLNDTANVTMDVFTSNQVEVFNSRIKSFGGTNKINIILNLLALQQLGEELTVYELSDPNAKSKVSMTTLGIVHVNVAIYLSSMFEVNGQDGIYLVNSKKVSYTDEELLSFIARCHAPLKRSKKSYVPFRKEYFKSLMNSAGVIIKIHGDDVSCSQCRGEVREFTYCPHVLAVLSKINNWEFENDLESCITKWKENKGTSKSDIKIFSYQNLAPLLEGRFPMYIHPSVICDLSVEKICHRYKIDDVYSIKQDITSIKKSLLPPEAIKVTKSTKATRATPTSSNMDDLTNTSLESEFVEGQHLEGSDFGKNKPPTKTKKRKRKQGRTVGGLRQCKRVNR